MTAVRPARRREQLFGTDTTYPCCFCGLLLTRETATLEHIVPVSKGGTIRRSNCELSCFPCNQERGSDDFDGFRAEKEAEVVAQRIVALLLGEDTAPLQTRFRLGRRTTPVELQAQSEICYELIKKCYESDGTGGTLKVLAGFPTKKRYKTRRETRRWRRRAEHGNSTHTGRISPVPPPWWLI
jgi:hypothetical protein